MNYSDERINELPFTEKIFAFADINSNLQVRCKGALYSFNDEDRLREILKNHAFPRTLGATANRWGDDSDISRNFGQDFNSVPLSSVADFSSNINPYSTRTLRSSVSANKRWLARPQRVVYSDFEPDELLKWSREPGHIYAGRGTKLLPSQGFGNPHHIDNLTSREVAVSRYRSELKQLVTNEQIQQICSAKQVMCHCEKTVSCHVDSLITYCLDKWWILCCFFFVQI